MKKNVSLLLAALLVCTCALTACGKPSAKLDAAGKYSLSESGEAILNDEALLTGFQAEDNSRVFYEIFTGSFSDSDGDGTGDLRGIINRMDYLNDGDPDSGLSLGVEGLWLTPIFRSPSYHKYDVTDYYTVDSAFGTQEDLAELIALCHQRNVKLILDLPINHTGTNCQWFVSFKNAHRNGDTADPYYDFYSYYTAGVDSTPTGTFAQISGTDDFYECNFSGDMPELNFDSDAVRQAVLDVAKYYLDMGVDGFRFDAAKYIYFGDNARSLEFWTWYLRELRAIKPDIYTVAEVWDGDGITDVYYAATDCFDFSVSQNGLIAETARGGSASRYASYVEKYVKRVNSIRSGSMFLPFITNHDMDRAAGFLSPDSGQMQVAANLYLLSPGSPFIYYGEELGMKGSRGGASTDANRRLAMVWGDGDTVKNPSGSTYGQSSQIQNGAVEQKGDSDSLYSYYKRLIMIRKANPEIARGEIKTVTVPNSKLGGFTATLDGSAVCVLHNTTTAPLTVDLSAVTDLPLQEIRAVIGMGNATLDGTTLTLDGQTSIVLR
ncbi:MAG: hypothetical protein II458_05495 [Oscillospiraceae bacterium]|nr:hypothetical protein [Oscillospiraceae bacterium]